MIGWFIWAAIYIAGFVGILIYCERQDRRIRKILERDQ